MASDTDAGGNTLPEDQDLGEGAEDLRDDPENAEPKADHEAERSERQIDKGLKETFPASDPPPANPGAD